MAQDFLEQLALDPANPKTWEPLLRHAAEEMADEIVEGAPSTQLEMIDDSEFDFVEAVRAQ